MDKMPNKFEFCTKYARAEKHVLEYFEEGMYRCLNGDGSYGPHYTAAFVKSCLKEGSWIMTKDLDEKPVAEPELKFPFTAIPDTGEFGQFVVTRGSEGKVTATYPCGDKYLDFANDAQVKEWIKDGKWIVTSATRAFVVDESKAIVEAGSIKAASVSINVECNTDQAMAKMERLRQAIEDVNVAMESFIQLQKDMKNV